MLLHMVTPLLCILQDDGEITPPPILLLEGLENADDSVSHMHGLQTPILIC